MLENAVNQVRQEPIGLSLTFFLILQKMTMECNVFLINYQWLFLMPGEKVENCVPGISLFLLTNQLCNRLQHVTDTQRYIICDASSWKQMLQCLICHWEILCNKSLHFFVIKILKLFNGVCFIFWVRSVLYVGI